jgi:hypothetical protein
MAGWSLEYSFDVDEKNAVIYEKIHGIWKAETAVSYHEDFKSEVAPLLKADWVKVVDLSNWRTSYPEVIEIIGQHLEWCINNNMVMSLNILNNPSTFRQLHLMFKIGGTKSVSHTFRTHDEARKFLQENWFSKKS